MTPGGRYTDSASADERLGSRCPYRGASAGFARGIAHRASFSRRRWGDTLPHAVNRSVSVSLLEETDAGAWTSDMPPASFSDGAGKTMGDARNGIPRMLAQATLPPIGLASDVARLTSASRWLPGELTVGREFLNTGNPINKGARMADAEIAGMLLVMPWRKNRGWYIYYTRSR